MKAFFIICVLSILFYTNQAFGETPKDLIGESGIRIKGKCIAIASSPDGYFYILKYDNKLIRIDSEGKQKEVHIPMNKEVINTNDYFCDMDVDDNNVYFCGYKYSSIVALNRNNHKELRSLNISYDNKDLHPMMVSCSSKGWLIREDDGRTFEVDKKGKISLFPQNSEIVTDKLGKAVIKSNEYKDQDGKYVYPGTILNFDKSIKWKAPLLESSKYVLGVSYLGYDKDKETDIYYVGYTDVNNRIEAYVYAINNKNEIVAKQNIPILSLYNIIRNIKLAKDGSIIAVYKDSTNTEEGIILRRFILNPESTKPQTKG